MTSSQKIPYFHFINFSEVVQRFRGWKRSKAQPRKTSYKVHFFEQNFPFLPEQSRQFLERFRGS